MVRLRILQLNYHLYSKFLTSVLPGNKIDFSYLFNVNIKDYTYNL